METSYEPTFKPCIGATTRYIGPTNNKGSRICVESWFRGSRMYYPYDHSVSCPHKAAMLLWVADQYPDVTNPEFAFKSRSDQKGYDFLVVDQETY